MLYLITGLASAIGPFFWPLNNEVVFIAAIATGKVDPFAVAWVISIGSTTSFLLWYLIGKSAIALRPEWRSKMERLSVERFQQYTSTLMFTGGVCAVPPVTAVALLSGSLHISMLRFWIFTFLGRIVRFLAMAWMADQLLSWTEFDKYHQIVLDWFR